MIPRVQADSLTIVYLNESSILSVKYYSTIVALYFIVYCLYTIFTFSVLVFFYLHWIFSVKLHNFAHSFLF